METSSSSSTPNAIPTKGCRLCRKVYAYNESRLNLYCTTKTEPESTPEERLLRLGIDASPRSNVSSTLCRKCNADLRNMLRYDDILNRWREVMESEQSSSAKRFLSPLGKTPTGYKKKKQKVLHDVTNITTSAYEDYVVIEATTTKEGKENTRRNLTVELSPTVSYLYKKVG